MPRLAGIDVTGRRLLATQLIKDVDWIMAGSERYILSEVLVGISSDGDVREMLISSQHSTVVTTWGDTANVISDMT